MWQTIGTACILTFLVVIPISNGLYFHIAETERKCFIEEIPDETMVTGNYKVQLYDPRTNGFAPSSPNIGMHVEVRDPEDKIILSKVTAAKENGLLHPIHRVNMLSVCTPILQNGSL